MGAKIADYKVLIAGLKQQAIQEHKEYLDCIAKDLMNQLNEGNATLITCCSAMRQCMLEDDKMLIAPAGKKNVSTKMKVRYFLNDLDTRPVAYVPKPRGRKVGSTSKKNLGLKKIPIAKMDTKFNHEFMTKKMEGWLKDRKFTYTTGDDQFLVEGTDGKWLIAIDYEKRGKKQTFNSKMYTLIKAMDPKITKYSIIMESKISSKQEWKQLNDFMKEKLNITLFFINRQGKIKEYR